MRTRTKWLAALLACLMFLTVGSAFAEGEINIPIHLPQELT